MEYTPDGLPIVTAWKLGDPLPPTPFVIVVEGEAGRWAAWWRQQILRRLQLDTSPRDPT